MPEIPEIPPEFDHRVLPAAEQTDNSETDSEQGRAMSPTTDASDPTNEILTSTSSSVSNIESAVNIKGDPPSTISSPSQSIPIPSAVDHSQTNESEEMTRGALSHDPSGTQIDYVDVCRPTTDKNEVFSESAQNNVGSGSNPTSVPASTTNEPSITPVKTTMRDDDDSETGRSSQVDPDGASFRSSASRRFSDVDLMLGDELPFEGSYVFGVDPRSPPGNPPVSATSEKEDQGNQPLSPLASPLHIREVSTLENEEISLYPKNLQTELERVELKNIIQISSSEKESGTTEPENQQIIEQAQEQAPVGLTYRREGSIERPHEYNHIPSESDLSVLSTHTPSIASGSRQIESPTRFSTHLPPTVQTIPTIHRPPDLVTPVVLPTLQRIPVSATTVPVLPPANAMPPQQQNAMPPQQHLVPVLAHANGYHHQFQPVMPTMPPSSIVMSNGGKRKIYLRLVEDVNTPQSRKGLFLFKRRSSRGILATPGSEMGAHDQPQSVARGGVTVSWYEGTTSLELHEHVRNSVIRKLGMQGTVKLSDLRILDETTNPPEEIVLSPYIPDESRLLLRFTTKAAGEDVTTPAYGRRLSYAGGAPDSPSAAPSPHSSALDLHGLGLNANQLALLGSRLKMPLLEDFVLDDTKKKKKFDRRKPKEDKVTFAETIEKGQETKEKHNQDNDDNSNNSKTSSTMETTSLHPEGEIEKSLRQITELLIKERTLRYPPKQEKRQVIFVLANYFVLFLSLIAISAEIQARAPGWNAAMEQHLKNVQNCSKDQDALYECVSKGDLAGLVASVVLWISRSAATKRIFLFGFESPKKLWTVVYESMVTAVCWGFSYMFIRRGMNPDTNRNFLQKYWKDAVYGSLAGFNAAFMKHILKNLIPQDAIEDALHGRQLKILSWLPSFA